MAKKFFTVCKDFRRYRVFLDDVALITKRIRKARPSIPVFACINENLMSSAMELEETSDSASLSQSTQ